VAKHDPTVQRWLTEGPRNASYTSAEIQNDILKTLAKTVNNKICENVRKAGMYSILADETKDFSKSSFLSSKVC